MSGSMKNRLLLTAVVLLTLLPLVTVKTSTTPGAGQSGAIFTGTDTQAQKVIQTLAPGYRPWFESLFKPPSVEIESLLFALQAAIGAGVLGYYLGYVRGKKAEVAEEDVTRRAH